MNKFRLSLAGKYLLLALIGCSMVGGMWPVRCSAQSALPLLSSSGSIETKINAYFFLVDQNIPSNLKRAKIYLSKAKPLAQALNRDICWGKYHRMEGKIAAQSQDPDHALKSYITAAEYFQRSRKYTEQCKAYLELGNVFHHQRNHQKAMDYYQLGFNTLQHHAYQNLSLKVQFYTCIGRCNLEMKKYFPSLNALTKAQKLAEKAKLPMELCGIFYAFGQTHLAQKKYPAALSAFQQAENIAETNHFLNLELNILDNLCRVSLILDSTENAKKYGFSKKTIALQLQDSNCINISNCLISQAFLVENQLDSALKYNILALKGAVAKSRDTTERDIWVHQANILARQNRAYEAVLALEKAQTLEDNIASGEQKLKAERLRQEMTIRRAEKQLQQVFEVRFKQERLIRYVMLLAVFLAALISLFLLFKVRIRQKANRQLKKQNTKIEEQKNQLEQLSQVKDQLFAVISHDLRSPLWAIQAVLDTLNEIDLSQTDRKRWIELLHQQTAKTSVMLENLLYWAKIQMNSYQPVKEEFKLRPIVEDLSEAIKLIFLEKSVQIKSEISPDFTLYSDPGMIRMALRNILANAVKFSNAGQAVEVRASKENNGCAIQIKDYGIGMNEEQLHKAMKGQLSRFGTKGEVGSGMGLSLVKQFIESQGGKLLGQGVANEGCVFTIILPLKDAN